MSYGTQPQKRYGHVAIRMEHYVLVIGGTWRSNQPFCQSVIWIYNLYTEQWRRYAIPDKKIVPPGAIGACAVTIGEDVYMSGGYNLIKRTATNALWKLIRLPHGCFTWNEIVNASNVKTPSPRMCPTGWEHSGKLWLFGGKGLSPAGYLNDYGDYADFCNNQLLCFDPSGEEWTNLKCSGSIPSPRECHSTTIIGDTVWLYGGCNWRANDVHAVFDDLYDLRMHSLTWTQIQLGEPSPKERFFLTLNAVSDSAIVLHGGAGADGTTIADTWILDIPSHTWRKYASGNDHSRESHTGTKGLHGCIYIVGGKEHGHENHNNYTTTFLLTLEPKSLKQLAMLIIYRHQDKLPWRSLPRKLAAQLGISRTEEDTGEASFDTTNN